jgi:hypothetical protein
MFAVEMLPAGHGDALIVEYGTRSEPHQVLIDSGTFHAWPGVRTELLRRRKDRYEVFVISHVDEDHIGGAIALLDDPNLKQRVDQIWFNGYVHCKSGGDVLGPVNGEQFTTRIVRGGFRWNEGFTPRASSNIGGPIVVPRAGALPCVDLPGGARLVLLSPSGPKLAAMAKLWSETVINAGLVPGMGDADHSTAPRPRSREADPLPDPLDLTAIKNLAAKRASDGSPANGTCIAFIVEFGLKRVLFGADAHAKVLTEGLHRYALEVGQMRPRFELVKLSHHGSNANLSTDMLSLIDCRRWLISTNGDNFAHPDDAAIAKVIASSLGPLTFFCNYRTARTTPWEQHGPGVGATFRFPTANGRSMRVPV